MKKFLLTTTAVMALCHFALAQTTVLYQEDWGTGNSGTTFAQIGWTSLNDLGSGMGGANYDATTGQPIGQNVWWGANSTPGIFYTTSGAGAGTGGNSAFTSIDPTLYTNLQLSVYAWQSWDGTDFQGWFAVQVGGSWYVSTNHPLNVLQGIKKSVMTYNPNATNWNVLAVDSSSATIGGPAAANLSGQITGVGIVTEAIADGPWANFSLLQISSVDNSTTTAPSITLVPKSPTVYSGGGVSFQVAASGTSLSYYWQKDGVALTNATRISGVNSDVLHILNTSTNDQGAYSCIVSNSAGTANTADILPASLTVVTAPTNLIYAEDFPTLSLPNDQNVALSTVGWYPNNATHLWCSSSGNSAPWFWESSPGVQAFFVNTASDTGFSGLPFPSIGLASHTGLTFSTDIDFFNLNTNVISIYWMVQMNGGNWYVSSSALPTAINTTSNYTQAFLSGAANWNDLTVNDYNWSWNGNVTVGGPASTDLTGSITGAGIVVVYSASNTGNGGGFDNFQILGTSVPNPGLISVGATTSTTITLNWTPNPNVHLQSATNLTPPVVWSDVPNTTGQSTYTATNTLPQVFYRLIWQ